MKKYMKPTMEGQMFVSNEFVSACGDSGTTYLFECNAGTRPYEYITEECHLTWDGIKCEDVVATDNYPYDVYRENGRGMGSYGPCGEKHEAPATNEFIRGYMVHQHTGEKTDVIIWTGPYKDDIHCTTNLDMNSWSVAKS